MAALSGPPVKQVAGRRLQRPVSAIDHSFERIEELARRFGSSYDSYIATDVEGKSFFWASDGSGVLSTIPTGRFTFVYGGILAPPEAKRKLIAEFVKDCEARRSTPSFFNTGIEDVGLLREFNFAATKFGEEPIVELDNCSWKGKDYEWVRRQTNFCGRNNLQFEEIRKDEFSADQWEGLMDELDVISSHFLEEKPHAGHMKNIVSRFCRTLIFGQRIFIARNTDKQQIEAFVMCSPCDDGDMWAIESYRKRNDAVRGVIPFLMHQCMIVFQREGVSRVTLSMLPLIGCDKPNPGDSWLLRKTITFAQRHGSALYDSAGLYHFKTRFRPHQFNDRFICVRPRVSLGLLMAGMQSWGFHQFSVTTAVKKFFRQWTMKSNRKNMAKPTG